MKHETEQLLSTLEVLNSQTFLWETDTQGEFNPWNLIISEGFVNLTDVERAFEHWQNIEQWGTPTNQEDHDYAPPRGERKDETWNEEIATQRQSYYQQLRQFLHTYLQNIQAYNLSVPISERQDFEWEYPDFSISIVVGEMRDRNWLCIAPTVPNQVNIYRHNRGQYKTSSSDNTELQIILDNLNPITIYGYYDGGYKYTYQHQIVCATSSTKAYAIEQALRAAQMLLVSNPDRDRGEYNNPKLYQFLTSSLQDFNFYLFSFWDIGYIYEVGQAASEDWLGVRSTIEFEYNP